MMLERKTLHEGWTVAAGRGPVPDHIRDAGAVPASVPGSVHTDLLAGGLIPDPYLDENEKTQAWIGITDWTYRTVFDVQPGDAHQELVFQGLDTIAKVRLNGVELGETRNMHRTHRFDVSASVVDGSNELVVEFASPVRAADAASLALGYRPHTNHHPYNAIRKMACSFGWDWGIDTSTSGIWRPVTLESWSDARFGDARIAGVRIDGEARLQVAVPVRGTASRIRLRVAGVVHEADIVDGWARVDIAVPGAELWWPRGHGAQPLYDLEVDLLSSAGEVLDRLTRRIGFRSAEVRLEPDADGTAFTIVVNDRPILVRGANWIPEDAFPHRVDRDRYARRLAQAEFAGINLIRVWGGGIYESEDFYAECDERGILTWQDFLLACAAYAEEEPLWSEFEAEAAEAIARLGAHPSLVVLNGNNENIWGYQDWNWPQRLDGRTWGAGYYYDLFPKLVADIAPHVPYTPGSPFSPDRDMHQNDASNGTTHVWDLWNVKDWPHYRDHRPRFVAEFGWQGPPTWSALVAAIGDDPLTPESPGMLVHQKAAKGNDKLTDGLTAHVPLPNDMADWHWAMSLNQAVAVRTAIEWWRSLTPHCTGTIMWQLNDCWPVTSWAAVDGAERRKPLLYALKHAHRERLLTVQPDGGALVLSAVNDTADRWTGEVVVERRSFVGGVLATERIAIDVAPRSAWRDALPDAISTAGDPTQELVVARLEDDVAHAFFAEARDSQLAAAELDVAAHPTSTGWTLEVTAHSLVRELTFLVDRLDPEAIADDALVTLLPGERATLTVSGATDAAASDFAMTPVLRTLNDLVQGGV
ncbi:MULTISPECIES: glycosyl hydrolase 2 galactose-binding domain-containing protein [unclassified Microbacterium]|uniref:glycoside hydrolase family 2 protein n=1 Tax=unclassified Microbacterium TaxID=2609290 RepID=UPI000EA8E403|nr:MULTISPECIES: glycoside hydrolase family 2 protein [unclassified Microbacterium]MBT2483997.1 glycoside hydrolase family 2 protein [Microbacterium sp. ISL-108]RKN66959.1 glycoside hydrolase family 2 protein [Microbacterium sp. CGR2]